MTRRILIVICGLAMVLGASTLATAPRAAAAGCPNVEVISARGTVEPGAPMGLTGLAFAAALRSTLPGKSVAEYGVKYPASGNFGNRLAFAHEVLNGIKVTQNRIKYIAAVCPRTRIVLSGYSQGAVVIGYALNPGIPVPAQYEKYRRYAPARLPASVAKHVASVVLFAPPSARFIRDAGAPPVQIDRLYARKTVRYCIPGDTICNGAPLGQPNALHVLYTVNGDAFAGARFTAARL
ncbi:cutinase family protein [Gordonia sp. CPCC 205333]|uniref:cutinase family protein n=1 Tax=Gordonia sp. CPCC 205333 TaxID=3140790 RepID=UPI003AF358E8